MHRLKQEQQVSPPPPAHSTSFRWPIPPLLPPPEAQPTTFEWDPTFTSPPPAHSTPHRWPIPPPLKPSPSSPSATAEEAAGIIRFLKGSYANHVLPALTAAKEAVAVMRTTARPTIARDRLSSQSRTVTIRLVRLKDYLDSAYLQDLPRMLTGSGNHDHPGHPSHPVHLPPPPKTVKITKLSEQDLQWRLNRVLAAAHTLREIALEVAWQAFSDEKAAAATAPEVFQQKQQDIFSAYLQVRDSLKDVLKLFRSALFWVEKATAGGDGRRGVAAVKTEQK